jgi:hypothetical protein
MMTTEELVKHYGGVTKAAIATGTPRTTLQSRLEQEKVGVNRTTSVVVPCAVPAPIKLAKMRPSVHAAKHFILPDPQCRPGVPLDHMRWAGLYCANRKPTKVINLGDHWDMPSLCSYDKGKRAAENMRYMIDIKAGNKGMELFMEPIAEELEACWKRGEEWSPEFHLTFGNHDWRAERAADDQPELEGLVGYASFDTTGWITYPFLEVAMIDGIAYSHYFTSGTMGRPVTTARALLTKKHQSCVMGHVQRYETAMDYNAEGKRITGLFAGCFYQHEDGYRDTQSNIATWRGVHVLYGVNDGEFTHNAVDLPYLKDRFGGK